MSPKSIGPFTLEERIGIGGMGTVYRAVYTKTGREVALKVLSPEFAADEKLTARFEREVNILKKLQHPHIVKYFGCGREGKQRFLIMEVIEGGSLEALLKERGRFSWEMSVEYCRQICEALGYLHEQGIVHRDLKPANLLLGSEGHLKLSDFGIARDSRATALTAAGRTVGTYSYMAPEQIRGKPPVSPKTDLYALGCVLFELLTGRPPFEADTEANMLFRHLQDEPPRVMTLAMDCPVWLESVVMQLLEKDPAKRPLDAASVQSALTEVHEKMAVQASVSTHAVSGGPSTLTVDHDASELIRLLKREKNRKKKRKKSEKHLPVYERTWFLVLCLLLVVGGVTWAMQPLNEDQLFAEAEILMQAEEPYLWSEARDKYLTPLLERFPDSKHAPQAREYIDRIEVHVAETRAKARMRTQKEPENEAQRLFIEAYRFEQFGDRVSAHEKFLSMVELLKDRPEDRAFVLLARQHIADIEAEGSTASGRTELVMENLQRAESMYDQGKTVEARGIWNSIITLYGNNSEMEPLVKRARARLAGEDVQPLPDVESETSATMHAQPSAQ